MNLHAIPPLLRREKVLELTGFTSAELDREIERGLFPPPVKLSPEGDSLGWNGVEVAQMNAGRIAGESADELRRVVAELVALRAFLAHRSAVVAVSREVN